MEIAVLILFYQIVLISVDAGPDDSKNSSFMADSQSVYSSLPPDNLRLKVTSHCRVFANVNLKQVKRALANEHLPIWILHGILNVNDIVNENSQSLERNSEVMKELDDFTTYQEAETSSAAIYFHKRREFDGMIGYELVIKKLSINSIHSTEDTVLPLGRHGIKLRPKYKGHNNERVIDQEDPSSGVNDQESRKTYHSREYDGYPEILVIVSWDVAEIWTQEAKPVDRYSAVVSNVLTLFNGVDMLYSKLEYTNIKINIAGIIIGMREESFAYLENCYFSENGGPAYWLGSKCTSLHLRSYLYAQRKTIPIDSYDVAIFLTRENIVLEPNVYDSTCAPGSLIHAHGVMENRDDLYECRKIYEGIIMVGIVTVQDHSANYPTIAHEMAHSMTVKHDKPPFFTPDGNCCGNIMKIEGSWCHRCLSWSTISQATFYLFFSSPNCCALINKPQSLNPAGRQVILTADEQCQCFGYESARLYEQVPDTFCKMHLQCKSTNVEFENTVIPMDGTPCGTNKVCWQKNCEDIQVYKDIGSLNGK